MVDENYLPIIEIVEEILKDHRSHNELSGQMTFCCPKCSYEIKGLNHLDGKFNLEVNYKKNVFHCWSCDDHGSLYRLIKQYGTKKQLKKFQLLKPETDEILPKKIYKKLRLPDEYISFKDVKGGMKLLPQYKQAINYLTGRNITKEIIEKYNIGFCLSGEYENRIIIPSYDNNGELNYFVGRSFLSRTKQKYKNPNVEKNDIIFNERLINWDEPVYLVEGVFDSIFLPNSIPMLGKFISDVLYEKIYENAKKVIIVLDGDAWQNAVDLYYKIDCGKLMGKVWIVELPYDKDIADLMGQINNEDIKQLY
jgi:DNA primase